MENRGETKKFKILIWAVFIACFAALAVMAFCSPLAGDDYIYAFNDNSTVRPLRLIDIVWNIQMQRRSTSARFISHFFVQLFIMVSKNLFNVVNALINTCALYCLFVYFREKGKDSKNLFLLLCAVFMIWVFMPVFGEIYVWLDGSCNYSWAIALLISFLLPYYNAYIKCETKLKTAWLVLFLIACPLFGAYSENGSAAGIMIAFFLMLLIYIRGRKLPWFLPAGFALACGGYLFLISSPVIMRKGTVSGSAIKGIFDKIGNIIISVIDRLGVPITIGGIFAAFLFIAFAVYVLKNRKYIKLLLGILTLAWLAAVIVLLPEGEESIWKTACAIISEPSINLVSISMIYGILLIIGIYNRISREKLIASVIMTGAGLVSVAVFAFAIYFPARSACYFTILAVISSIMILSELIDIKKKKPVKLFASALAALFIICFAAGMADSFSIASQHGEKLEQINSAKAAGESSIILDPYYYNTKYAEFYGIDNIGNFPCWLNHYMAMYYGLDDLIADY